jgi:hypothetical protein
MKIIKLLLTVSVMAVLASCSISCYRSDSNNLSAKNNDNNHINIDAVEGFSNQFGHSLARHILRHPDVADDIRCKAIPTDMSTIGSVHQSKQLCLLTVITDEPDYFKKTTLFVKTKDVKAKKSDIKVLTKFTDYRSSYLSDIGFSENGKYVYLVFTDEGHPFFVFWDTQKLINNEPDAQVGEVFEEYFLDHIESFYDNGDFVYVLREGTITGCLDGEVEVEPKTDNGEQVKRCLFHHNIFDQYRSFSSKEPFIPSRSIRRIQMPYVCNAFH